MISPKKKKMVLWRDVRREREKKKEREKWDGVGIKISKLGHEWMGYVIYT